MDPGYEENPVAQSAAELAPYLDELSGAGSLTELAGIATRLAIDLLGATAAVVNDASGPLAARPTTLAPAIIAELRAAPMVNGVEPALSEVAGLQTTTVALAAQDEARMTVGWKLGTPCRTEGLKAIINILDTRIELIENQDRTLASAEQRQTEAEFRGLIDTIPAIIYKAEMGRSGRWHFVSPQIEQILGYTTDEWLLDSTLWFKSIHPDDIGHAMAFEDDRLIGHDIHPPAEYRLRRKDGRYIWIYERARLIADDAGLPVWHGLMQDITALKSAESVIQQKVAQQLMIARLGELAMEGAHPNRLIEITIDSLAEQEGIMDASVWEQTAFIELNLCHSSNPVPAPVVPYDTANFPGNRLAAGEIVSILDWGRDPRVSRYRTLTNPDYGSSMLVPIGGTRGQFGLLAIHSKETHRFSEQDGHFFHAAANILANSIERHRADEALRHRLQHDPLTDLPNRQLFTEKLAEAIDDARTNGRKVGVLFLDIDHFKLINDGIGHHAGDEMLREVSPRLSFGVRRGDTVARFGGDEFGIVLSPVQGEDDAREITDRLLDEISRPISYRGVENFITASVGIAIFDPLVDREKNAESLIQEADAAMYQAKTMGRAQAQVFGQPMRERAMRRLEVERDLRRALEEGELRVHYQPIVSLKTRRIFAFEALVRWQHPENGLVAPKDFIPIAEESDLITQIDTWVLTDSLRQMAEWQRMLPTGRNLIVAVNASARQIRSPGLAERVGDLLEIHGVDPKRLALEITESVLVTGTSAVKSNLHQLHDMGVKLALDDFGTGFSSLSYLNEFPLDSLKIDRTFIEHLGNGDPKGSAITDAIIQIGRSLSLTVVAEAVASEMQLEMVRDLGCQMAQGFLISRAVPAVAATRMLEDPAATFIP